MKFLLEIELGNEAMQTGRDIAAELNYQAQQINHYFASNEIQRVTVAHVIRDDNGNTVGKWQVSE